MNKSRMISSTRLLLAGASLLIASATSISALPIANAASNAYGNVTITNVNSGRTLDVVGSSKADKGTIEQWRNHNGSNQRWNIIPVGNYVEVQNVNSGKCIDVPQSSHQLAAALIQWTCKATDNQLWAMQKQSSGAYIFVNKESQLAMDVAYSSTSDGATIQQYSLHGHANQLFTISKSTAAPTTTSTVKSTTTTTVSKNDASGQAIPTGDIPGWRQVYAEDFSKPTNSSSFDATYTNSWCGYANGTGNKYYKVISAHDGLMDIALDGAKGAAGSFGDPSSYCSMTYGRYSIRFKAVDANGYGTAMMIWPTSNTWGEGEVDYPEGDFDGTMSVHQHGVGCTICSAAESFNTGAGFRDWHTATTEWTSSGVKYYLDGDLIKTTTINVPVNRHRMTIQMAPTSANAKPGHLLIAWVAQWAPN